MSDGELDRGNGRRCDMAGCDSHAHVKAVRDPEDNLFNMCGECRREWPVEVVDAE